MAKYIPWILLIILAIIFYLHLRSEIPIMTGDNSKDSVFYWQNKLAEAVASLRKTTADFGTEKKEFLDSFANVYKTTPKNVKEIIIYKSTGHDTIVSIGPTTTQYKDSAGYTVINSVSQFFTDPYYSAQATIYPSHYDSSFLTLNSFDTLSLIWKNVSTGNIFNRKNFLQLDIHSANPHNQISGIHAYKQALPKPPNFGIGFFVGYGYSFTNASLTPSPLIGIGLSWTPIKF